MFCPEGFVTLNEIFGLFSEHARHNAPRAEELPLELQGPAFEEVDDPSQRHLEAPEDEQRAYANWLMGAFLELYGKEVRVVLPSGTVVRPEQWILNCTTMIFYYPVDRSYDHPYREFFPSRGVRLSHLADSTAYIDARTYTIDRFKSKELLASIGLRHLDGCPLCVKDDLLDFDSTLGNHVEKAVETSLLEVLGLGRFEVIGHPMLEKIFKLVEERSLSRDEVKKIVGSGFKAEEWRALWREAAALRPDLRLSVPGPKGPRKL